MPFRRRPERQSAPSHPVRFWQSVALLADIEGDLIVHFVYQNVVPEGAYLKLLCGREGKVSARLQPGRTKEICEKCAKGLQIGVSEQNAKEVTAQVEIAGQGKTL